MGRVRVYHPASNRSMDCSDDAFERIYSAEGWELASDPEAEPVKKTTRRSSKAKADDADGE